MTTVGRISLLCLLALTALSFVANPVDAQWFSFGFNVGKCQTDDEVPQADRAAYEGPALEFARAYLGAEPSSAYAMGTAALKQTMTPDAFATFVRNSVRSLGSLSNLHVAHSYYLTGASTGTGRYQVLCTAVAHGGLSSLEGHVLVAATPAPEQAHVIVEGDTRNNTVAFVLWLIPEEGQWRVQNVHLTATAVVGKSSLDLWSLARAQRERHHEFNAYLLYAAAIQLASRGPAFQLSIQSDIEKELRELRKPAELDGKPPFSWHPDGPSFRILNVAPVGVDGKLYLKLSQEVAPWSDAPEVDRENRDLVAAFTKIDPDYADAFDDLIIEAVERGGSRVFRTLARSTSTL
jgi:hypothetical protein